VVIRRTSVWRPGPQQEWATVPKGTTERKKDLFYLRESCSKGETRLETGELLSFLRSVCPRMNKGQWPGPLACKDSRSLDGLKSCQPHSAC
jgi:hypothetical protein